MGRKAAGFLALAFLLGASPAWAQVGSPAGAVPPARLASRRDALLARVGTGVVVLKSAEPRDLEGDYPQDSDYREDNDFFYLTGVEAPGGWLVLAGRPGGAGEAVLYLPPRDPRTERWTGAKLGPDAEAAALTGIRDVRSVDRLEGDLTHLLSAAASPAGGGRLYLKPSTQGALCTRLGAACAGALTGATDLRPEVAALRLVKDEDELTRLRRAIEITAEAQREAMQAARPGLWEYELEALIEYTFRRHGAERVGFPSIVGSGPNSTVLHYDKSRRRMEAGDLVVVDIGAEFGYYTADVTRTIPVSGRFSPRQRQVYELVLGAQEAAIRAVRPGVTIRELNGVAQRYLREHSGDLCGTVTCDRYFVHGLSHWLGMDVHDVGAYDAPLAPGMVLTVEPGVYLPDEALGVRIEDDVLVTATGGELLSRGAPRTADEIERLMASGRRAQP